MPAGVRQRAGAAGHVLPRPEASEPQSVRERHGQRTQSSGSQLLRAAAAQRAGLRGVARGSAVRSTPLPALRHRAHKPRFLLRHGGRGRGRGGCWTGPLTSGCSNIPATELAEWSGWCVRTS